MNCIRVWLFDAGAHGPRRGRWSRELRRALAQACVAEHAGVPVPEVELGREPGGRPVVLNAPAGRTLALSVSDAARHLAIAVMDAQPGERLGIDIEPLEGRPVARDLLPWLAPAEAAAIAAAPPAARRACFLGVWTQKEACLKALGLGLEGGLARFEVEPRLEAPAAVLRGASLHVRRLHVRGLVGAIATDRPNPLVAVHHRPLQRTIPLQERHP